MSESQRVLLSIENHIALVTLNRADKHNALDIHMFTAIDRTIKQLRRNKQLRAVIVHGAGADFCSGLDVKAVMASAKHSIKLLFKLWPGSANLAQRVSTAWRSVPCPVIIAVQGRCWGGGLQIALGADFRIASPDSNWSIMEGRWGLIPDMGGTLALRKLVRQDIALQLAMSAQQISGGEAERYGLVTHLSDDPLAAAKQLAQQLSERSPDALAAVKKLYHNSWQSSAALALCRESWYQIRVLFGKNQRIAVQRQLAAQDDGKQAPDYQVRRF